jgi:exosome complex component RRP4
VSFSPQVLCPLSALLNIDVQNDFISGTLALSNCPAKQDGNAVVSPINYCMDNADFNMVVYSSDWHPKDHISFVENVKKRKLHHTSKVGE